MIHPQRKGRDGMEGTAAENGYFGLATIDGDAVKDMMARCPSVFKKLGE